MVVPEKSITRAVPLFEFVASVYANTACVVDNAAQTHSCASPGVTFVFPPGAEIVLPEMLKMLALTIVFEALHTTMALVEDIADTLINEHASPAAENTNGLPTVGPDVLIVHAVP